MTIRPQNGTAILRHDILRQQFAREFIMARANAITGQQLPHADILKHDLDTAWDVYCDFIDTSSINNQ